MVEIGKAAGVRTVALITAMDTPLGRTAGNGLEVAESVEVLAGGGPSDVRELTLALATEMLACAGIDADPAQVLDSGKAMDTWKAMIRAQGGDPDAPLPVARHTEVIPAAADGYLTRLDAMAVGLAAWRLGRRTGQAGRSGTGRGRRHLARQCRGSDECRPAAVHAAHRHSGADRASRTGDRRCRRDQRRAGGSRRHRAGADQLAATVQAALLAGQSPFGQCRAAAQGARWLRRSSPRVP